MSEPFFSEHWYRVASLRPRLGQGVTIARRRFAGRPAYVLTDPLTGKSHRLTPHAYALIHRFDGRRTLGDAWSDLAEELGPEAPGQSEVMSLVGQLHGADLIATDRPPDVAEQAERRGKQDRQVFKQNLMGPLSFRLPLFDPDPLLSRTLPLVRWLVGPLGVALWLALVVWALSGVIREFDTIRAAVTDQVLSAGNLALIAAIYVPIKLLHELAHGWVAKRYGVDVHDFGLMFLVFMPVPYVDITAAGALPGRGQRIFVSAAGIMVETALAAGAFLFWRDMEPGLARAALFNVMLIGGVSTVLVNGNPLLRFDGYFILSDLLGIPNLAKRANDWWADHWQATAYRAPDVVPKPASGYEATVFALYAPAAFVYRIAISLTIAAFLVSRFFILGVVFAAWSLFNALLKPVAKAFWTLTTGPRLQRVRGRAVLTTAALGAVVLALLFALPAPWATRTQGVVWLPPSAAVRSDGTGFLAEMAVAPGALVTEGQLIARLDSAVAAAQAEVAEAHAAELRLRLAADAVAAPRTAAITRIELRAAEEDLARALDRLSDLEIRARATGRFEPLKPAGDLVGAHVARGEEIGHVLPTTPPRLRFVVGQSAIDTVRQHLRAAEIRLPTRPAVSMNAGPLREIPAAAFELPSPVLGTAFGGPFPVDPRDETGRRSLARVFQFETDLPEGIPSRFGGRVHVRLDHGTRPLGLQLADALRRLFLRGFDV
ncbi:M50 family metallopeptidase [Roseisalinus antarcticus]|uniref:Peptidase family M50 n=1 Tax=Roseisalinus antarcticus TaxID=254357 RepID=A0A1Y5TWJ1_9RHOB|nr:M50 family metallopeptidase [Roseisalinus antarcticus]SLN72104.1 hypothetical protein ROA7023_03573 [Roseisalinus antarcticus]